MAKEKSDIVPKGKRLSQKQWAEAESLWELGQVTLAELSEKYGKHQSLFWKHFSKRGIKKGSKAEVMKDRIHEAAVNAATEDMKLLQARIRETKDEHYKMAQALAKLTWSEVLTAKQSGTPFGAKLNDLRALDSAMNVLAKARQERYAVLGLDKDDFVDEEGLPELVISELTQEQIELLNARDASEELELDMDVEGDDDAVVEES